MSTEEKKAPTVQTVKLANGIEMPMVGAGCAFGNWTGDTAFQGFLPEQAWRSVSLALKVGIRHLDTAHMYGTERHIGNLVGQELAAGRITRDELFITTKLAHPQVPPNVAISHRRTWNARDVPDVSQRMRDDMDISLEMLGMGYVDLLLMHWPGTFDEKDADFARKTRAALWAAMEGFLEKGIAKAIGVCNFTQNHLEQLLEDCTVKPMVNQLELHPYCQDHALTDFCRSNQIAVAAFAPFASGAFGLLKEEKLVAIAERVKKSVGQVILRWHIQQGNIVLPKSGNEGRLAQNIDIFDFELTSDDMAAISALNPKGEEAKRTCPDPATIV